MILTVPEFNAIMAAFPLCTFTSSYGRPKRAIPPGAPIADLVEHLKVYDGTRSAHAYWCHAPNTPRHMHIGTTQKRHTPRVASAPSKGDRT